MLRRGAGEVDAHCVAVDLDRRADLEVALGRLDRLGRLVAPVRHLLRSQRGCAARRSPTPRRRRRATSPPRGARTAPPRGARRAGARRAARAGRRGARRRRASSRRSGRSARRSAAPAGGSGPPGAARSSRPASTPGPSRRRRRGARARRPSRAARRSTSIGETSVMSGRCEPPRNGSLSTHTSPGATSCARTAATEAGSAPRWTGMCSAWITSRPAASNSAVEQSRRSLMLGDSALWISAVPISSAIPRSEPTATCSSAAFTRSLQPQDALLVGRAGPAGRDEAGRLRELHDRRALDLGAGRQAGPAQHLGVDVLALPADRAARSARRRRWPIARTSAPGRHRGSAQGHQLDGPVAVGVAVAALVLGVERVREPVRVLERHQQLERLAGVAQVGRRRVPPPRRAASASSAGGARRARSASASGRSRLREASRRRSAAARPTRGQHAAGGQAEHLRRPELGGELARVQRPGAAERDQRRPRRVVAALDRHHAQRLHHRVHRHRDDALGRLLGRADAERLERGRGRRRRRAAGRPRSATRAGSRPSTRFASVTVGSVPPRP